MGAPRGGTEIEEERKQCGPAVTRFGPHTGETNHRAHSQAWATSPRRRNRGNPSRLEDRQTRRERQPQGSRREETRGQGSMPATLNVTGNVRSTLDPIRARHHRNGRARFHPSHRWTHNKQQPTTGTPNSLHRQQKTPGPPWTNDVVRYPPGGGRNRACPLPRVPGPVPDGP